MESMGEFRGAPKWRGGEGYTIPNKNLKTIYFVSTIILDVLCDLVFNRNQQLKSADDQHIRVKQKHKNKNLKTS